MSTYTPRNPYAFHPLMKKGGVHQKGKTAQRQNIKQQLNHDIDEWFDTQEEETEERSKERSFLFSQKKVLISVTRNEYVLF